MSTPTLRQTVEGMALGFDPRTAAEQAAVLEFEAPQELPRHCHLVIEKGVCRFATGPAPRATTRIRTDGATIRRIGSGELEVRTAVADGHLSVEGDMAALALLGRCFHRLEGEALRDSVGRPPGPVRLPAMGWMAVAFAPWEALWIALALHHLRAGALVGLALAIVLVAYRRAAGTLTFFEAASAVALAGAAVLPLERLPGGSVVGASFAALAAIWAMGTAMRPLGVSGEYTRWKYVSPLSATALFRYPNVIISLAWAGGFLANAFFTVVPLPGIGRSLSTWLHVATFAICAIFTVRHERGAAARRLDDIDRRLAALRRMGWPIAAAAMVLLGLALTR